MAKPYIRHTVPATVKAWLKKEAAAQKKLHKKIAKQMADLAPKRAKWYQAFFERLQDPKRGFNIHYTDRRQLAASEIPEQHRKDRVNW